MGPEPVCGSVPPGTDVAVGVTDVPPDAPGVGDALDVGEEADWLGVGDAVDAVKVNVALSLAESGSCSEIPAGPGSTVAVPLAPV